MSMLWIKRNTISLLEVALEPKKESEKSEKVGGRIKLQLLAFPPFFSN